MDKKLTSLSTVVYDSIFSQIMNKELRPGEKIPEKKIAETFNISRSPVREALHELEGDGLIRILPNRLAEVVPCNEDTVRDVGMLRIFLDFAAVRMALLFGSNADFLELKKSAVACDEAAESSDANARLLLDLEFHNKLVSISRNSLLIQFQREMDTRVRFIYTNYPYELNSNLAVPGNHVDLAEALIARNEHKALSILMKHHIKFYNFDESYSSDFFDFGTRSE